MPFTKLRCSFFVSLISANFTHTLSLPPLINLSQFILHMNKIYVDIFSTLYTECEIGVLSITMLKNTLNHRVCSIMILNFYFSRTAGLKHNATTIVNSITKYTRLIDIKWFEADTRIVFITWCDTHTQHTHTHRQWNTCMPMRTKQRNSK